MFAEYKKIKTISDNEGCRHGKIFGIETAVPLTIPDQSIADILASPGGIMALIAAIPEELMGTPDISPSLGDPQPKGLFIYRYKAKDYVTPFFSNGLLALPSRASNRIDAEDSPYHSCPWLSDAAERLEENAVICVLFEFHTASESDSVTLILLKKSVIFENGFTEVLSLENGELHLLMAAWKMLEQRLGPPAPFSR